MEMWIQSAAVYRLKHPLSCITLHKISKMHQPEAKQETKKLLEKENLLK